MWINTCYFEILPTTFFSHCAKLELVCFKILKKKQLIITVQRSASPSAVTVLMDVSRLWRTVVAVLNCEVKFVRFLFVRKQVRCFTREPTSTSTRRCVREILMIGYLTYHLLAEMKAVHLLIQIKAKRPMKSNNEEPAK